MNNAAGKIHCSRATSLTFCLSTQEKTRPRRVIRDRSFRKVGNSRLQSRKWRTSSLTGVAYIADLSIIVHHSRPISKEGENRDASYKSISTCLTVLSDRNIFCKRVREKSYRRFHRLEDYFIHYLDKPFRFLIFRTLCL